MFISYFGLFLLFSGVSCSLYSNISEENLPYSYQTSSWQKIFKKIDETKLFTTNLNLDECVTCNLLVSAILMEVGFDMTFLQLAAQLQYFCSTIPIQDDRVCEGVIDLNELSFKYMYENGDKDKLTSGRICSLLLGCNASKNFQWTIDIPTGEQPAKVESSGDVFKIAHLTDLHYDPNYTEGKTLDCNEPLCCQSEQADAKDVDPTGNTTCGYYSSYPNADISLRLLKETLTQMTTTDFDWVYFTGDLVAHRVWNTSQTFNSESIRDVMTLFAESFTVPVYPILGNHETHPVNLYAPLDVTDDSVSSQWLFDTVADVWSEWLGKEAIETVKKGGYYTVKSPRGLRIIVLNNNVCQKINWWNLHSDKDPYDQLQWLANTLKQAEADKEIVHILLHIPNRSCLSSWGVAYNKLIERFSNTIAAQFNGHTHRDQFHIFYDSDGNPNNVAFNGGSLIPDRANPNYKIYSVYSTGFDIEDQELYTFDLLQANKDKKIEWKKLYSYKSEFGVKNLLPSELHNLVDQMNTDSTLSDKYYRFYFRDSPTAQVECDEDCKKNYICEIVTTVNDDTTHQLCLK